MKKYILKFIVLFCLMVSTMFGATVTNKISKVTTVYETNSPVTHKGIVTVTNDSDRTGLVLNGLWAQINPVILMTSGGVDTFQLMESGAMRMPTVAIGLNAAGGDLGEGNINPNTTNNIYIGLDAGRYAWNSERSIYIGSLAGQNQQGVSNNVTIGYGAGQNATYNNQSTFVGVEAGAEAWSDLVSPKIGDSTLIGYRAGRWASQSQAITAIGNDAGRFASNCVRTTLLGYGAGEGGPGSNVVAIGYSAGAGISKSTSPNSIFIGLRSGQNATNSPFSISIGNYAGGEARNSTYGTFIGYGAGQYADSSQDNVYIGSYAGEAASNTARNVAIGGYSQEEAVNNAEITSLGYFAAHSMTNSSASVFIGSYSGIRAHNVTVSAAVGADSMSRASNCWESVAMGFEAGEWTTGSPGMTHLGYRAGKQAAHAPYLITIGHSAGENAIAATNSIYIGRSCGYGITRPSTLQIESNPLYATNATGLVYGEFDTRTLVFNATNRSTFAGPVYMTNGLTMANGLLDSPIILWDGYNKHPSIGWPEFGYTNGWYKSVAGNYIFQNSGTDVEEISSAGIIMRPRLEVKSGSTTLVKLDSSGVTGNSNTITNFANIYATKGEFDTLIANTAIFQTTTNTTMLSTNTTLVGTTYSSGIITITNAASYFEALGSTGFKAGRWNFCTNGLFFDDGVGGYANFTLYPGTGDIYLESSGKVVIGGVLGTRHTSLIDMGGSAITNLLAGSAEMDAVNYNQLTNAGTWYVRRDGTTPLTGNWAVGTNDITDIRTVGVTSNMNMNPIRIGAALSVSPVTNNIFIGIGAGEWNDPSILTALDKISIGTDSGKGANFPNLISIGKEAGYDAQATDVIAIGRTAGYYAKSANIIAIGQQAGWKADNNSANYVAIGYKAGYNADNMRNATLLGTSAGEQASHSPSMVAVGVEAAKWAPYSTNTISIGENSGRFASNSQYMVNLGVQAGYQASNTAYTVFIGYQSGYNSTNQPYKLNIDASGLAAFRDDGLISGNFLTRSLRFNATNGVTITGPLDMSGKGITNMLNGVLAQDAATMTQLWGATNGIVGITLSSTGSGTSLVNNASGIVKSLVQGANITITDQGTNITIASSGGSGIPDPAGLASNNVFSALNQFNWINMGGTGITNASYISASHRNGALAVGLTAGTNSDFLTTLGVGSGDTATNVIGSTFVGSYAAQNAHNSSSSVFIGTDAGVDAQGSFNSLFAGYRSGSDATNSYNSVFLGNLTGQYASNANNSSFIGSDAGSFADSANYSVFVGDFAGGTANYASNSVFMGAFSGLYATNSAFSVFIGNESGLDVRRPYTLVIDGNSTYGIGGTNALVYGEFDTRTLVLNATNGVTIKGPLNMATNAITNIKLLSVSDTNYNVRVGLSAGNEITVGRYNAFIGNYAGSECTNAYYSLFAGEYAGSDATNVTESVFLGHVAGKLAPSASLSVFVGGYAGQMATTAAQSTFVGYNSGSVAINAFSSEFIGVSAGGYAANAYQSLFAGDYAGYDATNAYRSVFLGSESGFYATNANNSVFIGYKSGLKLDRPNTLMIETTLPYATNSTGIGLIYGEFDTRTLQFNATNGTTFLGGINMAGNSITNMLAGTLPLAAVNLTQLQGATNGMAMLAGPQTFSGLQTFSGNINMGGNSITNVGTIIADTIVARVITNTTVVYISTNMVCGDLYYGKDFVSNILTGANIIVR